MKKISIFIGVFITALSLTTSISEAYFTTGQTAKSINSQNALFTISYKFGHDDKDMYLPATAFRNDVTSVDSTALTYGLYENGDEAKETGVTQAVIISKAPVVDGMYKIAKGTVETFTLLVLFTTNEDELEADYALHVDALPFSVEKDAQQLNPSELQYYTTNETELNTGNYKEKEGTETQEID